MKYMSIVGKTLLASSIAICLISPTFAAELTLKLGHPANEHHTWHKAAKRFSDELNVLTDGRIEVAVYPNESLGKELDLINGMQLGTADMTISGESLQNWAPMAALLAVPYAYETLDEMDIIANGEIGEKIKAQIIEKARVRPIAYFARGPRNLTSNRPISHPDALKGLKMRVPNVPLFVDVWKALDAQPTPMAFSEVFTSLQNGTIEAQENPLALIKSANFNEVQSHVNLTEHVRSWIYLAISELSWNKLSDADKKAVMEAAKRAQTFERQQFLGEQEQLANELKKKGMIFIEVDKAAFAAKAKNAVLANVNEDIKPIVEKLFAK